MIGESALLYLDKIRVPGYFAPEVFLATHETFWAREKLLARYPYMNDDCYQDN
jgi:hypothetical protein